MIELSFIWFTDLPVWTEVPKYRRCSTESENRGASMLIEEGFIIHNENKIRLSVDYSFVPQITFGGNIEKTHFFCVISLSLCSSVQIFLGLVWCI